MLFSASGEFILKILFVFFANILFANAFGYVGTTKLKLDLKRLTEDGIVLAILGGMILAVKPIIDGVIGVPMMFFPFFFGIDLGLTDGKQQLLMAVVFSLSLIVGHLIFYFEKREKSPK